MDEPQLYELADTPTQELRRPPSALESHHSTSSPPPAPKSRADARAPRPATAPRSAIPARVPAAPGRTWPRGHAPLRTHQRALHTADSSRPTPARQPETTPQQYFARRPARPPRRLLVLHSPSRRQSRPRPDRARSS